MSSMKILRKVPLNRGAAVVIPTADDSSGFSGTVACPFLFFERFQKSFFLVHFASILAECEKGGNSKLLV